MSKIKIELTKPQYHLLMEAIHDHGLSLDAIANSQYPQKRELKMLERIKQKLINSRYEARI